MRIRWQQLLPLGFNGLTRARLSTTQIIPLAKIRQKIYQSTKLQNITWSFVKLIDDSRLCDDIFNYDRKIDGAFKNLVFTNPKESIALQHAIRVVAIQNYRHMLSK